MKDISLTVAGIIPVSNVIKKTLYSKLETIYVESFSNFSKRKSDDTKQVNAKDETVSLRN